MTPIQVLNETIVSHENECSLNGGVYTDLAALKAARDELIADAALIRVTAPDQETADWLQWFLTLPPGTRCVCRQDGFGIYRAGDLCSVLTHAKDGTSMVLFDNPLAELGTDTKPPRAWWCATALLEPVGRVDPLNAPE
jgi:hypothetical protein